MRELPTDSRKAAEAYHPRSIIKPIGNIMSHSSIFRVMMTKIVLLSCLQNFVTSLKPAFSHTRCAR